MQQTMCIQCFDDLQNEVSKTHINKKDMNHTTLEIPMFKLESIIRVYYYALSLPRPI
jgi:hypothetical protein